MIKINTKIRSYALGVQKKIGLFDFPFTLNPYIGCEMQCAYCFVPGPVIKKTRNDFFTTVEIKDRLLDTLKKELKQYKTLPQHLKRVQIGVTTELFQPKVISNMRIGGNGDLVEKILATFKNEWDNGNKWMLHVLTKNHNIVNYLPILKNMKEMIQVEFSFIHHDEAVSRKYEKYTSSISKRLDAIKQISNEGIFVRAMAMPFYGNEKDLIVLRDNVFNAGAQAFKNKEINYYDWNNLDGINPLDDLKRSKTKTNNYLQTMVIKSGEEKTPKIMVEVEMPKIRKRNEKFINWAKKPNEGLEKQSLPQIEMGYSSINNVDWGYLK